MKIPWASVGGLAASTIGGFLIKHGISHATIHWLVGVGSVAVGFVIHNPPPFLAKYFPAKPATPENSKTENPS